MPNHNLTDGHQMLKSRMQAKLGNPQAAKIASRKKWFYCFSVYSFVLYLVHEIMFSQMFLPQMYFVGTQVEREFFHANFFVVQGMILCSVAAFVLMLLKRNFAGAWLQTLAGVLGIVNLLQIVFGEYNHKSYLAVAYGIAFLACVFAFSVLLMLYSRGRKLKAAMAKEYEKIYKRYRTDEDTLWSEEELEAILVAYETAMKKGVAAPQTAEEILSKTVDTPADDTKDGE